MSIKKGNEVMEKPDQSVLEQLAASYPREESGRSIILPRLGMYSQDKTEETGTGKAKKIKVVNAAGEFFLERQSDEEDEETGKKKWIKDELGTEIEGIIFYKRHQLRMYDEKLDKFASTPVFDSPDEELPLFMDGKEVARGTPADLKGKYMFTDRNGKEKSRLEDNRILYILYKDDVFQMNLRGSSMYSYLSYERNMKGQIPTLLTKMSSEPMQKGDISWNKMTFESVRMVNAEEAKKVLEMQKRATEAIAISKASYAKSSKADKDLDEVAEDTKKSIAKKF